MKTPLRYFLFILMMTTGLTAVNGQSSPPPPPPALEEVQLERPFVVVEEMPKFPGCEGDSTLTTSARSQCQTEKINAFILANLSYPAAAKEANIEGKVIVQFTVGEDGLLTDIRCVRGLGYGTCEEAVRIASLMNEMPERWIPGKQSGRLVKVRFTLPIMFTL